MENKNILIIDTFVSIQIMIVPTEKVLFDTFKSMTDGGHYIAFSLHIFLCLSMNLTFFFAVKLLQNN